MFDLGEDEHGTWLWRPPGASMQKGKEPSIVSGNLAVQLITRGTWWTAMFSDEEAYALYVDITTPAEWHGDRVVMVDLDLDVVRSAGAEPEVHDDDEFAEHRVWLGLPPGCRRRGASGHSVGPEDARHRRGAILVGGMGPPRSGPGAVSEPPAFQR